ncbi:UDP-glucose/GDP-mannose dehydrogenase family protein [bacterium]|nr:UDP-glucose/GDP-mannose dehydrogenase family protein [bacterium]
MRVCVIGTGYVGLVTGICLADIGNNVICVDIDKEKIEGLKKGIIPIYEPGLEEMVERNLSEKRISFTTEVSEGVENSEIIFIAVGTPSKKSGEADLSYVEAVSQSVAKAMDSYRVIVEKSTVPVHTGEWVRQTVKQNNIHDVDFDVVSNPEFLREGSAISDFMHPDRIVIGVESEKAEKIMTKLYQPLNAPIVVTDIKSAEIIKHASNSYLALKISYINSIANICERVGADVEKVAEGMGLDKRIGKSFLCAGIGYGGSCFPKDVSAFVKIAEESGYDFEILKSVEGVNRMQKEDLVRKIKQAMWVVNNKTIGILGLSFKPNTDDMREAPSIYIINKLQQEGAKIKAYDPVAGCAAKKILKNVQYCKDPYCAAKDSDALVIITDWPEFEKLDLEKIKSLLNHSVIIDGRNIYDPEKMKKLGFVYKSIGRERKRCQA